jgi:hypothetical protein
MMSNQDENGRSRPTSMPAANQTGSQSQTELIMKVLAILAAIVGAISVGIALRANPPESVVTA